MKRLVWLLALLVAVCLLTACGNGGDNASSVEPDSQSHSSSVLSPMENAQQPLPGFDQEEFTDFFRYYFSDPYFAPIEDASQFNTIADDGEYEKYAFFVLNATYNIGAARGETFYLSGDDIGESVFIPVETLERNSVEMLGAAVDYDRLAASDLAGYYNFSQEGYIGFGSSGYGRWAGTAHTIDPDSFTYEGSTFAFNTYMSYIDEEPDAPRQPAYTYRFAYVPENAFMPYRLLSVTNPAA